MSRIRNLLFAIAVASILAGCASSGSSRPGPGEDVIRGLDNLINAISSKAAGLLPPGRSSNLAVYYFTTDGRESPFSDYLINGLTTEMANKVPEGYNVVSRKGLDRIMEEYSFQLSDLVSEETQVDIGELLGADTIITGFITEKSDRFNINIQLLHIHTGTVLGGFSLDFLSDDDFDLTGSSEVVTMERQYVETTGAATRTIIYDTFDGPIAEVSPGYSDEYWGERIESLSGNTGIDPGGFAYLDFTATVDSTDYVRDWEDSDMTFYFDLPLGAQADESDGVYIKIKPDDFSRAYLFVKQTENSDPIIFGIPVTLIPGQWNELRVPFDNLRHVNGEKTINKSHNVIISVAIPYMENIYQNHFSGSTFTSRLSVDEVGLYEVKGDNGQSGISSFEDEINRVVTAAFFEGSRVYMDYESSDSGILRENPIIGSQSIQVDICDDGPVGRYLCLKGSLEVTGDISAFLATGGEIYTILDMNFAAKPNNEEKLSFLYSSDLLSRGFLYCSNPDREEAFESDFSGGGNWSRVSIPIRGNSYSEEDTGMIRSDPVLLRLMWQIDENLLRKASRSGEPLEFTIGLDELKWE